MSAPTPPFDRSRLQAVLESLDDESQSDDEIIERLNAVLPKGSGDAFRFDDLEAPSSARSDREHLEQSAWHVARFEGLEIARVPWPVVPNADGRLTVRERTLLWCHLVLDPSPLDAIDLGKLPPLERSGEPTLRALWRFHTHSGIEDLDPSHRYALENAHPGRFGLVRLVLEETRTIDSQTESVAHSLFFGHLLFVLTDFEFERQALFPLWKKYLLDRAIGFLKPRALEQIDRILDYGHFLKLKRLAEWARAREG